MRDENLKQVFLGKKDGKFKSRQSMADIAECQQKVRRNEAEAEERAAEEKARRRGSRSRTPPPGAEEHSEHFPGGPGQQPSGQPKGAPPKAAEKGDIKPRGRSPTQRPVEKLVEEAHKSSAAKVEENLREAKQKRAEEVKNKAKRAEEAKAVLVSMDEAKARLDNMQEAVRAEKAGDMQMEDPDFDEQIL